MCWCVTVSHTNTKACKKVSRTRPSGEKHIRGVSRIGGTLVLGEVPKPRPWKSGESGGPVGCQVSVSQRCTVRSSLAAARRRPSGENVTHLTLPVWASRGAEAGARSAGRVRLTVLGAGGVCLDGPGDDIG